MLYVFMFVCKLEKRIIWIITMLDGDGWSLYLENGNGWRMCLERGNEWHMCPENSDGLCFCRTEMNSVRDPLWIKNCFLKLSHKNRKKMWITIVCAKFQNCVNTTQKCLAHHSSGFPCSTLFLLIFKKTKLVTPELPPLKHVRTGERTILWEYVWRTILTGVCGEQLSKPPKQVSIPRPFHLDPYPVLGSLVSADISTRTMSIMVQIQLGIQDQQVPEPKWGIRRVKNGKFHGMR